MKAALPNPVEPLLRAVHVSGDAACCVTTVPLFRESPFSSGRYGSMCFFTVALLALCLTTALPATAQSWGTVQGQVTRAASKAPVPGASVLVAGTNFGTAAGAQGRYVLRLPAGTHLLRFTSVGYIPHLDSVTVSPHDTTHLDVALQESILEIAGITVEASSTPKEAGVYELEPERVRKMPAPLQDGLRALKAMPGVVANNELSSQYSVRGGGFNENLIFINGFEIFLPFRARQGEQEGLSLVNLEMADRLTFYTGGFPARYGGKLSSALEISYRRPENLPLQGAAYLSTLDAGLAARSSALDNRLGWSVSLRRARAGRLFGTQDLKGRYQPEYTDLQGLFSYRLAPGHAVEALLMGAHHRFQLTPSSRRTNYGILSLHPGVASNIQSFYSQYDGTQRTGFTTRFGGLRLKSQLTDRLRIEHDISHFKTVEEETLSIGGNAQITQLNPISGEPLSLIGHSRQSDRADNRVAVSTWTGRSRWMLSLPRHAVEAGGHVRCLRFDDRIREKTVIRYRKRGKTHRLVSDSLYDSAQLEAWQAGLYLQDALHVLPHAPERFLLTAGLRTDYFSFNDEWTLSPRLSARYRLSKRLTLMGSWGLYHQTPTYRELRGKPAPGETILRALNRDIEAQRSMPFVAGLEYFFPTRRLYLRAEAYYKHLTNLISYNIENVRVAYSGENDSKGFAYGLDLQLRGEFVPGLESWANYSYLVTRERFLPAYQTSYNTGLIPRPTDQRHTFSLFVQDYIPTDPTWKLHLRLLFGSGLPYTPPNPGPEVGGVTFQVPGDRLSGRYPEYKRVDLGITKNVVLFSDGLSRPPELELTGEILNLFDMINTVSYSWKPASDGIWQRVPTRLTPRTFNVRLRVIF